VVRDRSLTKRERDIVLFGAHFDHPDAESFSFNSYGSCTVCHGLGVRSEVEVDALVPDQDKTIEGVPFCHGAAADDGCRCTPRESKACG
jgi:excinuclease UvrABC ATPase subunit